MTFGWTEVLTPKKEKKRLAECVFLFFLKKNIFVLGLTIFLKNFLGTSSHCAPAARRQGVYVSGGWRGRGESVWGARGCTACAC